jgi:uracil phosphoribosyltransferase
MTNVVVVDHPLIAHKLSLVRDKSTPSVQFRQLVREISLLLGYEVLRDLPVEMHEIETPVATMQAPFLKGKKLVFVPVLRAGLGLAEGLLELVPAARVGHIGLYREPQTLTAVEYYFKVPDSLEERLVVVCDPLLATGNSAIAAVEQLKEHGARDIKFLCLVAAPEGIAALSAAHPDVTIYTAAIDSHLNEHGNIVPGLGDAADRLFGTK